MASPRAGQPAAREDLIDVPKLITAYYTVHPDPAEPGQRRKHRSASTQALFASEAARRVEARRDDRGEPALRPEVTHQLERALASSTAERGEEIGQEQDSLHAPSPDPASSLSFASSWTRVASKFPRAATIAGPRERIARASGSREDSAIAHASASSSPTGTR